MNIRRKFTFFLQLLVAILMLLSAVPATADSPIPENKVPGDVESTARRLTRDGDRASEAVRAHGPTRPGARGD